MPSGARRPCCNVGSTAIADKQQAKLVLGDIPPITSPLGCCVERTRTLSQAMQGRALLRTSVQFE
jgi:hypothetical protein